MLSQVGLVRQVIEARVYGLTHLESGIKFETEGAHRRPQSGERRLIRPRKLLQSKQVNELLDESGQLIVPCAVDRVADTTALAARFRIDSCNRERIIDLAVGRT